MVVVWDIWAKVIHVINKLRNKALVILLPSAALFIAVITNPQWYYFKDNLEYKNFIVYYDKSLPEKIFITLNQAEKLIKNSPFYETNLKFKLFLKSDRNKYDLLPLQFPSLGFGRSVQLLSNNIYISQADIETNSSHSGLGDTRTLSSVIAHEVVHVLIEKHFGYFKSRLHPYFKKHEFSSMGYLWKEEGYAEYIAGGETTIKSFEDGIAILSGKKQSEYNIHNVEYFKYYVAVKYLLEVEKIDEKNIFQKEFILDDLISKAIEHYEK